MSILLLMRHGEAEAVAPGRSDLERPLTGHGRSQAEGVGEWLRSTGGRVDLVITSPALRCRMTAEALALPCPIVEEASIHNAGSDTLVQVIRERAELIAGGLTTVLLVGHAPGIPALAQDLSAYEESDPAAQARLERGWPPATVGRLETDQPWPELSAARLLEVRNP